MGAANGNFNPRIEFAAQSLIAEAYADGRGFPEPGSPGDWYLIILRAERARTGLGMGLASVWSHIHRGDHVKARAELNRIDRSIRSHHEE